MTTFPRGRRNQLGLGSFADLTDVAVVRIDKSGVEFADDLPEDECAAVWARIESTDDADQAARATLRADRDSLGPDDPLRRLYDYVLGEMP